jgi:hypothetical protein
VPTVEHLPLPSDSPATIVARQMRELGEKQRAVPSKAYRR